MVQVKKQHVCMRGDWKILSVLLNCRTGLMEKLCRIVLITWHEEGIRL